jgi:phage-related protein
MEVLRPRSIDDVSFLIHIVRVRELPLSVVFYRLASGKEPVRDWLRSLDRSAKQAIGEDIKTLQLGWPLGMPLARKIEPGLWELRTIIVEGTVRIFFTIIGRHVVLLHGFSKKTRKTPAAQLELARKRLNRLRNST